MRRVDPEGTSPVPPPDGAAPRWALLGTLVFVVLVPGTAVGVVPYLLTGWRMREPLLGVGAVRVVGALLLLAGLALFVDFCVRFVREGHGTPAPVAPTSRLVVRGPYQWMRNPGYVAVLAMIVGQGLLLGTAGVLLYAAGTALGFHLFVVLYEEPTLRRSFGAEYESYCRAVPRWLPRLPAPRG
jgi:protein-S-isoprenylcysteine O-methyltransferase Ste14